MSAGVPLFLLGLAVLSGGDGASPDNSSNPRVVLETSKGSMVIELYAEQAPESVSGFLRYVDEGFYDGVIFHRVIDGFMVQGGGFDAEMRKKPTHGGIQNEADNGLKNTRGTLAMARTNDPHSASSQFFVNLIDNDFLDHRGKTPRDWGYTVFGAVVEGMDVVDAIAKVKTGRHGPMGDVPVEPVTILSAKRQGAADEDG